MPSLTVLILTYNEALHIERCIASVQGVANRVVVVDSGSTDNTRELAAAAGADVLVNDWTHHSAQVNWAIANAAITTRWTMRLDADEVVLPDLAQKLSGLEAIDANGASVNRQLHFMGRWIRWGGIYPVRSLRLWRTGFGQCEDRLMDEHIVVDGPIAHIDADIADINLNSLSWWTEKHNRYATLEAIEVIRAEHGAALASGLRSQNQLLYRHRLRLLIYAHLPLGARALAYFVYRYIILLGFLDGWQGLAFHGLQGGWYRFLVDLKVLEMRAAIAASGLGFAEFVESAYGHKL